MNVFKEFRCLKFSGQIYFIFLGCFWLLGYFAAFWRRIGIEGTGVTIANSIVLLFLAIMCAKQWQHKIRIQDFALYAILVLIYFLNSSIYPATAKLINNYAVDVTLGAMPFFFWGLIFKHEGNENWITFLSRTAIIVNILYSSISSSDVDNIDEQMNRAYMLLPSVLYLLWMFFERLNYIDLIFFLIGFFLECSMGTRGPFVCILFFAAVYLLFFKKYKHPVRMRLLIVIGSLLLLSLSTPIANMMVGLLSLAGKSTRIFDLMLDDSLINYENSNGRDILQGFLLQKLNRNNGEGFGLLADRLEVGFAHNILVELWYDYGYVLGSIIVGAYLLLIVILLIKAKQAYTRIFVMLFFTASFIKLLFSSSFIVDGYFFFLIGLCINGMREAKKQNKGIILKS